MNSVRRTLTGSLVACLLTMSLNASAELAQYTCLGQEHGQQATVAAASETQAVELVKVHWRTFGCLKDDAFNGDSAAPPATTQSPPSGVDSDREATVGKWMGQMGEQSSQAE